MCGRYARFGNQKVYLDEFAIHTKPEAFAQLLLPRFNIAPTQDVPIVRLTGGERELAVVRWGLLPSWTKDPKQAPLLINARAETIMEKPSFRSAFNARRCLIPASGFFEWRREGKLKQPYFFRRADERPLAFAGLWEKWNEIESCTIITTEANELMENIHDRMPVILSRNDYTEWLDPAATELSKLLAPCPADELVCYPVSSIVNTAKNEVPECVEPVELH
jgi:putative SOS response-associated peptidase YedK